MHAEHANLFMVAHQLSFHVDRGTGLEASLLVARLFLVELIAWSLPMQGQKLVELVPPT